MGYEGDEGEHSTKLALYVYCDSTQGQQKVAERLRKKLKGKLKIFHIDKEERDKKYFNVAVRTHSNSLPSDVAWFLTVFRALGLEVTS